MGGSSHLLLTRSQNHERLIPCQSHHASFAESASLFGPPQPEKFTLETACQKVGIDTEVVDYLEQGKLRSITEPTIIADDASRSFARKVGSATEWVVISRYLVLNQRYHRYYQQHEF